jgi:hypothetical protein
VGPRRRNSFRQSARRLEIAARRDGCLFGRPETLKGGPAQLAKMAERAALENMSLMDYLAIMRSRLMRQLEASSAAGDNPGVCRASQVLLSVLQELGRLTGEIDRVAGIVINNNSNNQTLVQMTDPLITKLQADLLRALAPYPEARNASYERPSCAFSAQPCG